MTDDHWVFQRAVEAAAEYDGVSTITLTAGKTYRTATALQVFPGWSGITIGGAGTWKSEAGNGLLFGSLPDLFPRWDMAAADKGDTTITTTSPSDLAAGDYVLVYTGQTNPAGFTDDTVGNPDSEINLVTAVSGATVTLAWPLAKDYRVQNYAPGGSQGNGTTSIGGAGDAAPIAVRKINPVKDITIKDITIEHAGAGTCLFGAKIGCVNLTIDNITGSSVNNFLSSSAWTGGVTDSAIHVANEYAYLVAVAYGARDVAISGCTFTADTLGYLHIHEGAADIAVSNTTITNAAEQTGTDQPIIGLRGRGYNVTLASVTVTNGPNATGGACLRVEAFTGSATGCTFDITNGGDQQVVNNSGGMFTVT